MKKIATIISVALVLLALAVPAMGADACFHVNINGDTVVAQGSEVEYTVTVDDITITDGVWGGDFTLHYDTDVFEVVSVTKPTIEGWAVMVNTNAAGKIVFSTCVEAPEDNPDGITANGVIKYVVKFKIKDTDKSSAELKIDGVTGTGTDTSMTLYEGTGDTTAVTILSAPANVAWDNGVAKWNAVAGAEEYIITLYKGDDTFGTPVKVQNASEYDFSGILTVSGSYRFEVTAKAGNAEATSAKSGAYKVVGNLVTPSVKLISNVDGGGLKYQITDTNEDGAVEYYVVEIYEKGSDTPAKTLGQLTAKAGTVACDDDIVAGKEYVATVKAFSADTEVNKDSEASEKSDEVVAAKTVKGISIKTNPKLDYVEGNRLDLSGMVVQITYTDDSVKDVPFAEFEAYMLTTDIADGKVLALSNNGAKVTVTFASSTFSANVAINVKSSKCQHETTHKEHKDATCGEKGFDRTVCDECDQIVTEKDINPTGKHSYGEWEIVYNPTSTLSGKRQRTCSTCKHVDAEILAPLGTTGTTQTEPPEVTEPEDTTDETEQVTEDKPVTPPVDPGDDEEDKGGMNDLSKIFLIVVIVIFSIILIFSIVEVWYENRRRKTRRGNTRKRR